MRGLWHRSRIDVESSASPERVIAGVTNFTDRRPDLWPGLNAKKYRVYEVGETWADVQEGNNEMIWARERYDWSTPGTGRWTVEERAVSRPPASSWRRSSAGRLVVAA